MHILYTHIMCSTCMHSFGKAETYEMYIHVQLSDTVGIRILMEIINEAMPK